MQIINLLTVFIERHATITDLQHVQIVPMTVASFLPHRGREVENARHGAIYKTGHTQRRPARDVRQTLTETSKFTVEYVCAGTAHIVVAVVLKKEGDIYRDSLVGIG